MLKACSMSSRRLSIQKTVPKILSSIDIAEDLQALHSAVNNILADRAQSPLGPLRTDVMTRMPYNCPTPAAHLSSPTGIGIYDISSPSVSNRNDVDLFNQVPLHQVPIKSLYEITRLESLCSRQLSPVSLDHEKYPSGQAPRDLVSEGKLKEEDADRLVQTFLNETDHYLYGITSRFENLRSIRCASSLLFTAICTVAALQEPNGDELFCICNS